ncbi:MAG: response regulator [Armatimonadota bacterium]|nr:response regulator [Armatimonadota bacterium]
MQYEVSDFHQVRVLVAESDPQTLGSLKAFLARNGYQVFSASTGEAALEAVKQCEYDVILCDLHLQGTSGLEVTKSISRMHPHIPIVVMTTNGDIELSRRAFEAGASDFIVKPVDFPALPFVLENNMQRKRIEQRRLSEERANVLFKAIKAIAAGIDSRSRYTGRHSAHMAEICLQIGQELQLSPERMATLELAAHIHDVGKLTTPESVLDKPGKLTPEEWQEVSQHPSTGAELLAEIDELAEVAAVIRHHHERYDGTGYPDGLRGEGIPFLSRILAVADALEAMTSDRPYRPAISWSAAVEELQRHSGTQFDPVVVDAAARVVNRLIGGWQQEKAA